MRGGGGEGGKGWEGQGGIQQVRQHKMDEKGHIRNNFGSSQWLHSTLSLLCVGNIDDEGPYIHPMQEFLLSLIAFVLVGKTWTMYSSGGRIRRVQKL